MDVKDRLTKKKKIALEFKIAENDCGELVKTEIIDNLYEE